VTRVIAIALVLLALPSAARADEERFSLALRGAAFTRHDRGYADHAEVFGLSSPQLAGGGVMEVGVRVVSRLWLLASWGDFSSSGGRRQDMLTVSNQAAVGQLGVTAWRGELDPGGVALALRVDLVAGGGLYRISDDLAGERHRDRGWGARTGAQIAFTWKRVGLSIAGGYNATHVAIEDRLGGKLEAGGVDLGGGLRLQL
jgi:hypothetical protein